MFTASIYFANSWTPVIKFKLKLDIKLNDSRGFANIGPKIHGLLFNSVRQAREVNVEYNFQPSLQCFAELRRAT